MQRSSNRSDVSFVISKLYDAITLHAEWLGLAEWRRTFVGPLRGSVLEIGAGTGRNLEHYGPGVSRLVLTEPDHHMRARLRGRMRRVALASSAIEICEQAAEALPFADATFDSVVATLVLCSVNDPYRSLREAFRVLRPGGHLHLIEHIAANPGTRERRWQNWVNPAWSRYSGGCRLDRDPRPAALAVGFKLEQLELDEIRGAPPFLRTALRGHWEKPASI